MNRARAVLASLLLVVTTVQIAPLPVHAADPAAHAPEVPDVRNRASTGSGHFDAVASSYTGAVIDNGLFQLGINPEAHMDLENVGVPSSGEGTTTVGLRYLPENSEALAPGCLCEGWGVADRTAGVSGWASWDWGVSPNLTVIDFQAGELAPGVGTAHSAVEVGGVFEVTHDFRPSPFTPNLYEIVVTVKNISAAPVDLVYRRKMDWDVEPTAFDEYVTIQGASDYLEFSSLDGFANPNPLTAPTNIDGVTGTFVDAGPYDYGALFDFAFGALDPGATRQFQLFYGAAPNEDVARFAVDSVGADVWSFAQPNVSDGPDPDLLLDGKEQGKPNTFIFAFASPDQCDEESLITLPPTAEGRVAVEYDPRFAAPDADPDQAEWARRIAEDMQGRADATLNEYEALGFNVDDGTITLRIECNNITGRNAFVESSSLVHFKSQAVRTWFGDRIRLARKRVADGIGLPDRGMPGAAPSPVEEWVNVLDHELAHTWQYNEVLPWVPVLPPLAFWLNYIGGNQPVIESGAVLSQDLIADADDLDPLATGIAPYPHSYMQFADQFLGDPDGLTAVGDQSEYEKAAVFQYWAERWANPAETDPERRAALFARDLVAPFTTGTPALGVALSACGAACPDLYSALKDFYIAAYAHAAPNVTTSQNPAFEFLDSELGNDGTPGEGQTYRSIAVTSRPIPSGGNVTLLGESLAPTEGRIYELSIGPDIAEIEASLTLTDSGFLQGLVWALVPFDPDGSADFAHALLTPDPSQLQTVQVTSGGRLAVVVVASQPIVPWDTNAVYDLQFDAPAFIGGGDAATHAATTDPLAVQSTSDGIVLLATPSDGQAVTIDAYPIDPAATVSVRRLAESGAEVSLGSYPGGATFDDNPPAAGRYLYEASADIAGSPVTVYSKIVTVADDVTPPRAWLQLDNRAAATNAPALRAVIGGLSEPVSEMRFALSEAELETATWVPFEAFSSIDLGLGDGVYRVFGQVRDGAGLESEVMTGEILLDTGAPDSAAGPLPASTNTASLSVSFSATDAGSFVSYVELWTRHRADASSNWGPWTMLATPSTSPADVSLPFGAGQYEFYTVGIDGAGNREAIPAAADASIQFTLPDDPPTIAASLSESPVTCSPRPWLCQGRVKVTGAGIATDDLDPVSVQYRTATVTVNGGAGIWSTWKLATATDGAFDELSEAFTAAITGICQYGWHFQFRATAGVDETTIQRTHYCGSGGPGIIAP